MTDTQVVIVVAVALVLAQAAVCVGLVLFHNGLGTMTDRLQKTSASNLVTAESNRAVADANVAILAEMKALHDLHERATLEAVRSMKSPLLGKELSA